MSRIRAAVAIVVVAVGALALARPNATAEFKKFLDKEGPNVMKAFKNKDIKYFERMSTSDFTYKEFGKPATNKKDSLAGMQMMFGMMKTIDASYTLQSVKVNGNSATVLLTSRIKGVTKADPRTKKEHKMDATTYEKETWVRNGKSWKLKSIVETKQSKMLMDGKPFHPAMAGG